MSCCLSQWELHFWSNFPLKTLKKKIKTRHCSLLDWMGIFIFGMNPRKETLIYVYRYIGNAKLWFLKPDDTIHFLLYENLQFSKKMNQKLLFYQKDCIVWFKNHDFTLPMYLHKHGLWRLFSCFHTENENPFRMWSNEALRWMFKS